MIKKEAIVLDKLKREIKFKQTDIVHCIGTSNFSLLEIITSEPFKYQEKISTEDMVVRRITYNRLAENGKKEIEKSIETIVLENPDKFVNFFNNAKPIGLRRHQLDLLPMIGSKHRMAIIDHIRKKGKFTSFEEITKIEMMPDPIKVIINRVIDELMEGAEIKYNLFTMPFIVKKPFK
jgi:putative nucleotide binding protein